MVASDTPSRPSEGAEPEQGSHEWSERLRVTEYFRARLAEEVRRAERYGRRFAVVYVNCGDVGARRVFNNVRPRMRCTDIVEVIRSQTAPNGESGAGEDQVAMILPETSKTGAQTAVGRVEMHLSSMGAPRLGVAYYPDDSTNPHQLFAIARRQAEEKLRP